MKWDALGQAVTVSVIAAVLLHIIIKRAKEYGKPIVTVEQERESIRENVAVIGRHHPTVGDINDDPVWAVMNLITENRAAGGM